MATTYFSGNLYGSPLNPTSTGYPDFIIDSFYAKGGLKSIATLANLWDTTSGVSWISLSRRQTGSIIYDISSGLYYMDNGGVGTGSGVYTLLPALTTGSPTFPGFTSSAGILITNGGNLYFSNGGNIATTGTASFSSVTASAGFNSSGTSQLGTLNLTNDLTVPNGGTGQSSFTLNGVLYGNNNNGLLVTAQGAANSVLIANAGAPSFSTNLTLGGNIQALGTASFGATTVSGLKSNGIISGSSTLDIVGAGTFGGAVTANTGFSSTGVSNLVTVTASAGLSGSLVRAGTGFTTSGYAYIQGNASVQGTLGVTGIASLGRTTASSLQVTSLFRTLGTTTFGDAAADIITSTGQFTASAGVNTTLINASTGFTSSTGYVQIGGAATSSTGFYSPGTSSLTTLLVSTINGSGLSTFGSLYVTGNTQLGDAASDVTSLLGTLSVVNNGTVSGSIICDSNGNLILDGSGISSGVQITDGILWLGASGSTGIQISSGSYGGTSYTGGMISSSMKFVALHGFANRTSDGSSSFEVDTNGNLECYSLKETSLRQYKHEIYYITESQLLNISKLKPVTFLYNQDVPQDVNDTRLRQAGFIAEQVQQIYPEVAWYKDGQLAGLQYQRLTAYLTRGIQELAEQNKLLKSRVQSLEQLVNGILQGAE